MTRQRFEHRPLRRQLRRVVRVQPDGRRTRRRDVAASVERLPATSRDRCRRTPSTRRPPPSRSRDCASAPPAQLQVTVGVDPRDRSLDVSLRGNSGAPFSSGEPAGSCPHAAASGSRCVLGPARQPEAAPQLGRRVRDHRRREQRDDAQRLEAVAEHLRRPRPRRPPCATPTARGPRCTRSSRGSGPRPRRTRREVEARHRVRHARRTRPRPRRRAARRRASSGTTPPQ